MPDESQPDSVSNDEPKPTIVDSQSGTLATPTSVPGSPSISATQTPYSVSRNLSSARVTNSSKNQTDMVREVQAKIAQADASIKSASKTNLIGDGLSHSGSISRKRIDPSQIGTPQLVSHSNPASLDAFQVIPSRSPTLSTNNNSGTSKIGSRFKKLRGTLRSKPSPLNDDSSTPSVNAKSPNSAQSVNYDPAKLATPGSPALRSAIEPASSKAMVPTPPASAGPTLKGFISRFRGKQRATEPSPVTQQKPTVQMSSAPLHTPVSTRQKDHKVPAEGGLKSPPPKRQSFQLNVLSPEPPAETQTSPSHAASPSTGSRQSVMIQQLFDAANNLGLDQNALNDLLVRSGSVSSRTPKLGRANSQTGRSSSRTGQRSGTPTVVEQSNSGDTAQVTLQPPSPVTTRSSQGTPEPNATSSVVFRPPEAMRRAREQRGDRATSAVVRRTIILPENIKVTGTDVQNVSQRSNSRTRRRSSVNSGSLKDRAPTPPPPRSPVGSRFSSDSFPPVPSMPSSLSPEAYLSIPRINAEKPTSAYDPSMWVFQVETSLGIDFLF